MSNSVFSYPIDECDVLDRSNLEKFRVFKADALGMLINDELSIVNQFYALSWETRVFHLINESWKIAKNYDEIYGVQNPIISEMLLNGYVFSQILGIRKLTDPNHDDKNRRVNSIPSLIHKIRQNINIFTRENFVCGDGLPYDFEAVKSKDHAEGIKKALENGGTHASWKPMKGPLAWSTSERFHIEFDKLSKTSTDKRARQDTISHDVLDSICTLYDCVKSDAQIFRDKADKYIAHAATAHSRQHKNVSDAGFKFSELDSMHKNLFLIINALAKFFGEYYPPYAIPQYDIYEGLDKPWLKKEDIFSIEQAWDIKNRDMDKWEDEFKNMLNQILV